MDVCIRCTKGRCEARRLCYECYTEIYNQDGLLDYPRLYAKWDETYQEISFLLEFGLSHKEICDKLGMKWDTYQTGIRRYKRRHQGG